MTTIKDIARAAGVAHATVSRALSGDETLRISSETRRRILKASVDLNYTPNAAARALRNARAEAIALVVHDVMNPVYAEIFAGAQSAADKSDHLTLVSDISFLTRSPLSLNRLVRGRAIDGIVVQGIGADVDHLLKALSEEDLPVVLLQEDASPQFGVVMLPDEAATEAATNYLIELGHEKIGFIGTAEHANYSNRRADGWKKALTQAGIKYKRDSLVWAGSDIESGLGSAALLIRKSPQITAIVAANVLAAIGALSELQRLGIRVPEDLSIIAVHDTPFASYVSPALTCVKMPLRALGEQAVQLLLSDQYASGARILVNDPAPELILRDSCAPPRAKR